MSNDYSKFLQRMAQYRERAKLTQKEVSELLGKDQSQFSKMELGKTVVSYEVLECLWDEGWDIDYIVTGKKKIDITSSLAGYLKEKLNEEWKELNEAIIWIFGHELKKNSMLTEDVKCEYELLKLFLAPNPPETLLLAVRNVVGLSQIVMAEKLGVNIKKYCQLEKGIKNPDGELLGLIYELICCRPGIFFCRKDIAEYLLDYLWNRFYAKQQEEIINFLDYTITVYKL